MKELKNKIVEENNIKTNENKQNNEEYNIGKNEEIQITQEDDSEITDKVKILFESIKNFSQLKNEVYEIKKYNEKLSQITLKNIEEQAKNSELNLNRELSEINRKFFLLAGDIDINDLDYSNNDQEIEGIKAMNLSEINTRLRAFQFGKANVNDLNSMSEEFDSKIKELNRKIDDFKINIFGTSDDNKILGNDPKNNNNNNNTAGGADKGIKNPRFNFVSQSEFEKFKLKNDEEIDKIWKEINSWKLTLDDMQSKIKINVKMEDLEELKNIILQKTEELFLNQNKKYSNYSTTIKILQENFKKLLKLLADRDQYENNQFKIDNNPISGHSCASCENYLGDLKIEQKYVNWNQFPRKERDNSEIFKKVQNGYSRLLQMINFDNNGNPTLNPYINSNNNETNISSNLEDNANQSKDKNEANQSITNKKLFAAKIKQFSGENNKNIELLNTKKKEFNKHKKLPTIKTSKSIDNFNNLKNNSNQDKNKNNIYFINPALSQTINETDKKNE